MTAGQDNRPIDPVIDRLIREAQAQGEAAGRYSDHACDLSGEWADRLTGPQVITAVAAACGLSQDAIDDLAHIHADVLDAYEDAYNAAACDASEVFACRDCVNEGYCDDAVRVAHTARVIDIDVAGPSGRPHDIRTNGETLCPVCGWGNWPVGILGKREQYRCRECGIEYAHTIPKPDAAACDIEIGGLYCLTRDVDTIIKVVQAYEAAYVVAYNATACDVVRPQDIGAAMHPDCVACGVPLYADDDDGGIVWDSGRNGWAHAACEQAEQAPRGADLVNALCASLHEIERELRVTGWKRDMERPHRLGTFGWYSPSLEAARDMLATITDGIAQLEADGIDRLAQDTRRKLDAGESIDG